MVPHDETMPYTIRIVSDILESNGSSSMASVCGGCLALMDAGVPMRKPVAGVAMGMISDSETGKYAILTDILGDEDHLGDMDFKVTGTRDGITACQMDIKVDGLSYEVLTEALEQARQGRLHILDEMAKTITEPRADYKEFVPRIETLYIPKDMIGAVIGPGGKVIQEMQKQTNTVIVITEDEQKGIVEIASQNKEDIEACKAKIKAIVAVPEVGEVYHIHFQVDYQLFQSLFLFECFLFIIHCFKILCCFMVLWQCVGLRKLHIKPCSMAVLRPK